MKWFSLIVLLIPIYGFSSIDLGGALRNDAVFVKTTNDFRFSDVVEAKLVLTRKTEEWRFYTDVRFTLYYGDALLAVTNGYSLNLLRMFIRYGSPVGFFTVGKTYVTFGLPGIFNPFEMDKNINMGDLTYDKQGLLALEWAFPFGDLSGGKIYAGPRAEVTNSSFGGTVFANIFGWDAGLVLNRKDVHRNVAGIFIKGDLELGVNASYAFHFNDLANTNYSEFSAGLDYSFFDGKLVLGANYYYNETGWTSTNDYTNRSVTNDTYLKARHYVYASAAYQYDEFLGFKFDSFINCVDGSLVLMPSVAWTVSDGLTLTLLGSFLLGEKNQEFSRDTLGEYSILFRVEGKL